jgi:GAF domain-containing protein
MKSSLLTEPMELPGASEVIRTGNAYQKNSTENDPVNEITLPVRLRGEVVGVLNVKNERGHIWTTDEIDVVSAILERAALAIENSRLLAESRKSAEKERLIGEITTRVSSYTNRDNILQTAVTEIGRILPGAEVAIQIQSSEENGKHS